MPCDHHKKVVSGLQNKVSYNYMYNLIPAKSLYSNILLLYVHNYSIFE